MSIATRFRILTSLGIGAIVAGGGAMIGYLMIQAAELFTWPAIISAGALATVVAFVVDVVTEPREVA